MRPSTRKSLPSMVSTSSTRGSRASRSPAPAGSARGAPPGPRARLRALAATPTAAPPPITVSTTNRIQNTGATIHTRHASTQAAAGLDTSSGRNVHRTPQTPMPTMNIIEAVRSALQTQMRADPRVIVLGEDIGKFGGVFRATSGLYDEFGADRVI